MSRLGGGVAALGGRGGGGMAARGARRGPPAALAALAALAELAGARGAGARRRVSWWWDGRARRSPDPGRFLGWVGDHLDIVDSVMLQCGVGVQADGTLGGALEAACGPAMRGLRALGVEVELWLGESDDVEAQRRLFRRAPEAAAAVGALVREHRLAGVNFDVESSEGVTAADGEAYAAFLGQMRAAAAGGGARLTVDSAPFSLMMRNVTALAGATDRVLYMHTYMAPSLRGWLANLDLATAQAPPAGGKLAAGLAGFKDARTAGWSDTPESARERLCWLMHLDLPEVAMFRISENDGWPLAHWEEPLQRFAAGEDCAPGPRPEPCPAGWEATRSPGETQCCSRKRSRGCGEACARAQCAARPGWAWRPEDFKVHPYTCCPAP